MVMFAMGLAPLPSLHLYWKHPKDTNGLYGNFFVSNTLSRNDFWKITKILHADIDKLVEMLNKNYQR
jgi:hypothetical protein